ncbi:MAG: replication protein [Deltaproteobacteria bacterium]
MANPQKEDGFVAIANELAEAFARIRISGEEWQCLWVILRKTYGWHKKQDSIPFSQFIEATGIIKQHINRAIRKLESKKVIIVTNIGYEKAKGYGLNKNYEEWAALPKKVTSPIMVTAVTNNGYERNPKRLQQVPIMVTSKETTKEKKDIYKRNVVNDESIRLAELLFSEIIKENSKSRLANQNTAAKEKTITGWALDIEKLIGIDKQEPSTVEGVIFFATHDDFWGANILSGKKLREKWDTLTMKMKQKGQKNGFTKPTGIEPFSDIPKALRGNW